MHQIEEYSFLGQALFKRDTRQEDETSFDDRTLYIMITSVILLAVFAVIFKIGQWSASKTQTLTLVIYPGKSKKDQEPVPNDSKQGESEVVPNSDEGPNAMKEVESDSSVSVSKEVAKHLEKDFIGNEREVGEDEKPGLLAVSRTGHSEPVSADKTNDDIREDLYGHQSKWSDKQGTLLTERHFFSESSSPTKLTNSPKTNRRKKTLYPTVPGVQL